MFNPFSLFARETYSLGIDIGSRQLKAVKAVFNANAVRFSKAHCVNISGDLPAAFRQLLQVFPEVKEVVLSVSGSNSVIIRYMNMPRMEKSELFQALKFEAEKYIPFPLAEVYFDAHILQGEAEADNKMSVLLAAAKKELINQRVEMTAQAGVRLKCVDIDALAVFNAFNFAQREESAAGAKKVFALLNISEAHSNLNIVENGLLRLSRDLHIAEKKIAERISVTTGLTQQQAYEKILSADVQDNRQEFIKSMEQSSAELAMELRISFDYFESQGSSAVSELFLSGEIAACPEFSAQLTELLGITVKVWDPLKGFGLQSELAGQTPLGFAVAAGLALRRS